MKNRYTISCLLIFALFSMGIAGCYRPVAVPEVLPTKPSIVAIHKDIIGSSVRNRPIEYLEIGAGWDVCLIIATIHGNEPAGTGLVNHLAAYLQEHPHLVTGRRVIIVPNANPDGKEQNSRANVRNVDLNRNFPAPNRQENDKSGPEPLSEPESRAIYRLIQRYHPNRIISIHQPLDCIDYDGPAEKLARRMAEYCRLPVKKLGARPGSLGSYAGETLGIPIITIELRADDDKLSIRRLWDLYGTALIAAIIYPDRP